jgi:hypothetical protein
MLDDVRWRWADVFCQRVGIDKNRCVVGGRAWLGQMPRARGRALSGCCSSVWAIVPLRAGDWVANEILRCLNCKRCWSKWACHLPNTIRKRLPEEDQARHSPYFKNGKELFKL